MALGAALVDRAVPRLDELAALLVGGSALRVLDIPLLRVEHAAKLRSSAGRGMSVGLVDDGSLLMFRLVPEGCFRCPTRPGVGVVDCTIAG